MITYITEMKFSQPFLKMIQLYVRYSYHTMLRCRICIEKLDKGFISDAASVPAGKTVVRYTIEMAKQLNLEVVSEGVETKEQADFLLEACCNIAQGYYFSKPVPVKKFEKIAFE